MSEARPVAQGFDQLVHPASGDALAQGKFGLQQILIHLAAGGVAALVPVGAGFATGSFLFGSRCGGVEADIDLGEAKGLVLPAAAQFDPAGDQLGTLLGDRLKGFGEGFDRLPGFGPQGCVIIADYGFGVI